MSRTEGHVMFSVLARLSRVKLSIKLPESLLINQVYGLLTVFSSLPGSSALYSTWFGQVSQLLGCFCLCWLWRPWCSREASLSSAPGATWGDLAWL